jgi:hypothetical protein
MMAKLNPYRLRVIEQGERWVNGESRHNDIDDECCADFSCCMPELFQQDRADRLTTFNRVLKSYGLPPRSDS